MLPLGDSLVIEVADGDSAERVTGKRIDPQASLIGDAFRGGTTIAIDDIHQSPHWPKNSEALDDFGPIIIVPLVAGGGARHGVLWVGNLVGGRRFRDAHQAMLEAFADQAALGLELARQRRETEQLSLFRDRDRIARDLHDTVIQRLFATGMQLESSMRFMTRPEASERVQSAVSDLDKTIKEIRSTIYALQRSDRSPSNSLRARIVGLIEELTPALGFTPNLRLEGLVDTKVSTNVGENLLPVLREALVEHGPAREGGSRGCVGGRRRRFGHPHCHGRRRRSVRRRASQRARQPRRASSHPRRHVYCPPRARGRHRTQLARAARRRLVNPLLVSRLHTGVIRRPVMSSGRSCR